MALIGPDDPPDRASHQGIFGSHYDEGRITRLLDPHRIWALLAQRSIARYREIEVRSSVPFYHEVGHLAVGPEPAGPDDYVARVQAVGTALGVEYDTYTDAALAERFPYLVFEPRSVGMYQPHTAAMSVRVRRCVPRRPSRSNTAPHFLQPPSTHCIRALPISRCAPTQASSIVPKRCCLPLAALAMPSTCYPVRWRSPYTPAPLC